ncbi:Zn-dependent hydrolase [Arthrobacter sp. MYb211]|uniref:M20 family metallo-hydrolase n=1 Tax=unclassified Arthrobacter TaxID=235627 RepID=UPI000CFB0DBC|nr:MULTISPECIES: M20 family metallo-hydrolase [unclassified Arthrobacter]PQZ96846.1 Zn-dependent hydrolase [Arthrobacter sp. MYb224]PRA10049.1 Zn-dependent hydrolase [Arthrobacter sp. MYb221]PRC05240.1 Zn-dependent hydrolase [Arthrobacter sp. MYb211]
MHHEFLTDFHHVATFGATANLGVDRQAATPEDKLSRDWFAAFTAEKGWELRVDGIGNMFALIEFNPGAPYILLGSHLDSQPLGGRFDGAYGVIAGLHAAQQIVERQRIEGELPQFNLGVVNWFNEEGGRFAPSIMGSSVFVGSMDEEEMLKVTDLQGISVARALEAIGYLGKDPRPNVAGYAEIHIEQGRVLERESVSIGAVDYSWHTQKLDVEVLGEQSHTGATAMADRHDALVAASKVILKVHDVVERFSEGNIVSSVGRMTLEPNSPIVVARRVHLVADLRAVDKDLVLEARRLLVGEIAEIAREHDIKINVNDFDVRGIQYYPESGLQLVEKVSANLGQSVRRIRTMAGHDSVAMNKIVPTVMMFIPSIDGVSHCEREFSTDEDMSTGLNVLAETAWQMIFGALDPDCQHSDLVSDSVGRIS